MATIVYLMCAATSLACAVLLFRGYRSSGARLLFWASLCFMGLALNNILVFVDERVIATADLSVWRSIPALVGVALLIYGLIWEVR